MAKTLFTLALAVCCTVLRSNAILIDEEANRISGGNIATDTQFPYVISLQELAALEQGIVNAHRCGGALITYQHALTAASCTYSHVNGTMVSIVASRYRVYAGGALLSGATQTERIRAIANYTVHPDHLIYPALLNDIAVLTLTTPYLNTTVIPIRYATNNVVPIDFTLCSIAGWGAIHVSEPPSNQLRFTTKYIYNHQLCTTIYNSIINTINIHGNMICAVSYDIYSAGCTGDVGNALVCDGQLTGILSLTNQCLQNSYPEVYTRVSNFTTFIRSVPGVSGASTFKPFGLLALVTVVFAKIFR